MRLKLSNMKTLLWVFLLTGLFSDRLEAKRQKKQHRIIDGRPASIKEFPYQVTLEKGGRHFCGGSIVHERLILTAAHCSQHLQSFDNVSPEQMLARVGTSQSEKGGVVHRVKQVVPHEEYSDQEETDSHDIAFVLLETPIKFNSYAKSIMLPLVPPKPKLKGWVTGYGSQVRSNTRSMGSTKQLMAVELPIVNTKTCKSQMKHLGSIVASDMFCAGYTKGNRDACRGDSGGPFQNNGVLYGAVAWGIGCGREGLPGVYTDLYQYKDWLQKTAAKMLKQ